MVEKETNRNYEEISRPYNSFLERSLLSDEKSLLDLGSTPEPDKEVVNSQSIQTNDIGNGSVETMPVKSEGAMGDVWIKNFIRSTNWKPKKIGFAIDGQTGYAEFTDVYVSGDIEALTGTIGGFTIAENSLYGTTTGTIKTAETVESGSTGVIMDINGLRGFDSVLGKVFDIPTDGSAPSFASGVIEKTTFEINTNAVLRTSSTVGDGTASSEGILINNTGLYACEANQTLANANIKALIDGTVAVKGDITATSGKIGTTDNYWSIGSSGITATSTDGDVIINYGKTDFGQSATSGFILGYDYSATASKFEIGSSATKELTFDGTDLSIKGGTITGGNIQSAESGTRFELTNTNQDYRCYNSNGDTVATMDWSSSSDAVLKLYPQYDARRALEIITDASYTTGTEADANAITIDNKADSISIKITDGGLIGLDVADCDTSAINVSAPPTNGPGIDLTYTGGDYPIIDIEQNGTNSNSYGIKITQGSGALKEAIYIDDGANSHLSESIFVYRHANSSNDAPAIRIDSTNLGSGYAIGLDFSNVSTQAIMRVSSDTTDPTGGGGAADGRIPIIVSGAVKYIPYYDE